MLLSLPVTAAEKQAMTLHHVLQSVLDNYPSIESALLQVKRARLNTGKAQSQLGWRLQGQAGIRRDVSLFGTGTDIISAGGSLNRQLDSGASVGIDASVSRSDSADSFPGVPNPSTSTSVDLNYRQPLKKGADNPDYEESLLQAELDVQVADAQRSVIFDSLAEQVIALYTGAINTGIREDNVRQAIARSKRRQQYLKDRTDLGVSEEKDLLQVDAQLKSQIAELRGLEVVWQTQRIQMNRLMGRPSDAELELVMRTPDTSMPLSLPAIRDKASGHNAELKQIETRIERADSVIRLRRNADEDQLDLVLFVGNRTQNGDTTTGSSSESELVGGASLEFQKNYDKRASQTDIDQAMIDKDAAMIDRRQVLEDIEYDAAALVAEIESGRAALDAYLSSVRSEKAKLEEAERRYRTGRSDTEQLLNFESQLSLAELSAELQKTELMRDHYSLELLQGALWQGIKLPRDDAEGELR